MDEIIDFYNNYNEEKRLVQGKAQKLEFMTTKCVLEGLIPNNSKILELGAGTGRYSFHYASRGHQVTATDVVPKHIEKMEDKLEENKKISYMDIKLVDAKDLSVFEDAIFDVVLSLGPLYHLTDEDDRLQCIEESLRVLKEGGILAVAYINKFFVIASLANAESLNTKYVEKILNKGVIRAEEEDCFWTDAHFSSPGEIEDMFKEFDVNKVDHVGTDGIGVLLQDKINSMDEQDHEAWVKYHLQICREPTILGYSNHGLYVCKKE